MQVVATSITQQVAVVHRAREVMEHRHALIIPEQAVAWDIEPGRRGVGPTSA